MTNKPNPTSVAVSNLDLDVLKKEISVIMNANLKNAALYDMVLKDISTCGKIP